MTMIIRITQDFLYDNKVWKFPLSIRKKNISKFGSLLARWHAGTLTHEPRWHGSTFAHRHAWHAIKQTLYHADIGDISLQRQQLLKLFLSVVLSFISFFWSSFAMYRSSHSHMFYIHRKTILVESLFNKVANFTKRILQDSCFPVNMATFLRTAFL